MASKSPRTPWGGDLGEGFDTRLQRDVYEMTTRKLALLPLLILTLLLTSGLIAAQVQSPYDIALDEAVLAAV